MAGAVTEVTPSSQPPGKTFPVAYESREGHYHILYRGADLETLSRPVRMVLGTGNETRTMTESVPMKRAGFYRVQSIPIEESLDTDGDGLTDAEELAEPDLHNPLNPAAVSMPHGTVAIPSREQFERLARRDNVPGAARVRELKFLITDVDTDHPKLHFINTQRHEFHYYFYFFGLERRDVTLATFNSETYFTNTRRKNLAGSLLAHDSYVDPSGVTGIYTMEFWPTDPVAFSYVEMAYELISASMPFIDGNLAYHPSGETQRAIFNEAKAQYDRSFIRSISTEEIFGSQTFAALNPGVTFGRLVLASAAVQAFTPRDIVIFRNIPNDLTHVGGIITEIPQTPLSHINLKAKQNNTPNAYIKDASSVPEIQEMLGEYVLFEVTADGYLIRPAEASQVDAYLESIRPKETQIPLRDTSVEEILRLGYFPFEQSTSVGAKAANLSELRRILPNEMTPAGYAVPFYYYDQFMRHHGLYDYLVRMLAIRNFENDPDLREFELGKFRERIEKLECPEWMSEAFSDLQSRFDSGTSLRCRSSTNNEDLPDFNGAGLYNSFTHHPHEGSLEKSIKQVWASMWNYRAFEERSFYRISHFHAAMGVIIHPNYKDEEANGVAVTKNIIDPNWIGYYVNVQPGEDLVTNPTADAIPEEFLVSLLLADPEEGNYEYEIQYVRKSNRRIDDQPILSEARIFDLAGRMRLIQNHFRALYAGDQDFGMEIEFKFDQYGQLVIKQARPWID